MSIFETFKIYFILLVLATALANIRVDLERHEKYPHSLKFSDFEINELKYNKDTIIMDTGKIQKVNDLVEFATGLGNIRVGLKNFRNLQYYGPLYLGSKRQKLNFVYDTGSSWLWFPQSNCVGCPTWYGYDPTGSSFFVDSNETKELFYGKGHVAGTVITDNVALMSMEVQSIPLKMLSVDTADDLEGTKADGILGLSPSSSDSDLLVEKLADHGIIDAKEFTVFIGPQEETSYVDFGKYKGDLTNITWANVAGSKSYWSVELDEISYKNSPVSLTSTYAVLDTGTSILGFPRADLTNIIYALKEERQLYYLEDVNLYGVRCEGLEEFYDLEIDINGHVTKISTDDYLIYTGGYCVFFLFDLGVNFQFVILGDSYLKGNLMVHDMEKMRVGIFPQKLYHEPHLYKSSNTVFYAMVVIILAFVVGIVIALAYRFCTGKEEDIASEGEGSELAERMIENTQNSQNPPNASNP